MRSRFRLLAKSGYQYFTQTDFNPKYDPTQVGKPHKSPFKKRTLLLFKDVIIYGSEWIEQKERKIYYR